MLSKKITCGVCGYRITPKKEEIYVAEEPRAFVDALTKPPTRFNAMDCPRCGCQIIATWIGGFEFPVPDGLEITPDWEIGYRQPSLIVNVFNSGDVKSGIRIEFRALGALTNPQLLNVNTQEFIKANISLEAGDVLTVSTGYGEKSVKLLSGGVESDAFRYLDVDSSYLQLAVGDNLFRYSADTNAENLEVSIYHNNLYLGV